MKTTTNKDMLNAIRNQASAEYQERMVEVKSTVDAQEALRKLSDFPTLKNEFIQTLINKVIRTDFFSKVYENPLKMLKKGTMPYGSTIEELFVAAATEKGFYESNMDDAEGLLKKETPDIKKLYITKNFAYVFKVSISDAQLKGAFMSQNGLSELVNQIVGSLMNGAEQKEYKDMIQIITAAANGKRIAANSDGKTKLVGLKSEDELKVMKVEKIDKITDYRKLAVKIRSLAGRMKFVSKEYNMAGVDTWSRPEDLVFLTTPETLAELDVNVLAEAFNVSKAEVKVRTILVDELPKGFASAINGTGVDNTGNKECYGILMDKDFVQAIDTVNESRQFENGRNLMTNIFLHKQGMLANCYFANCVAIVEK